MVYDWPIREKETISVVGTLIPVMASRMATISFLWSWFSGLGRRWPLLADRRRVLNKG